MCSVDLEIKRFKTDYFSQLSLKFLFFHFFFSTERTWSICAKCEVNPKVGNPLKECDHAPLALSTSPLTSRYKPLGTVHFLWERGGGGWWD